MKRFLLPLLLLSLPVHAATVTIKWVPPTTDVAGDPIPATGATSLAKVVVERGTCVGTPVTFGVKAEEKSIPVPATETTFENIPNNSTNCYRAKAFLVNNEASAWSNVVQRTITTPGPNAPVLNGTITIQW